MRREELLRSLTALRRQVSELAASAQELENLFASIITSILAALQKVPEALLAATELHATLKLAEHGVSLSRTLRATGDPGAEAGGTPGGRVLAAWGTEAVLVVDDDRSLRSVVVGWLEGQGYGVGVAGSVEEAEEVFVGRRDGFDLLLADVELPDGDGPYLFRRLAELRPSLRVLYMSGHPVEEIGALAGSDGHPPFVRKPFTTATLALKIREALDGGVR